MGIAGTLKTMSLPDVLQWLSMGLKTGILEFVLDAEQVKKIYFKDGTIIYAQSSDRKDSLGQLLLRHKKITEQQIEALLEKQKKSGILLGKILLEEGLLSEDELNNHLRLQSEEIVFSLFQWSDAKFEFTECEIPENEVIPISLKVVSLIMEGTKRQDDWSRIQKALPNPAMILDFTEDGQFTLLMQDLTAQGKEITDAIDGETSIAEICSNSSLSDFSTYSLLFHLMNKGILEVRGVKDESAEQDRIVERELIKVSDYLEMEDYILARDAIEKLLVQYPDYPDVKTLSQRVDTCIEKEVSRYIPNESIVPKASYSKDLSQLNKLNISAEEGFLLSRIDGAMSIKEIRMVSGFSKKEIHFALFRLAMLGVIDLGKNSQVKMELPQPGKSIDDDTGSISNSGSIFTEDLEANFEENSESDSNVSEALIESKIQKKYHETMLGNYYELLEVNPNAQHTLIEEKFDELAQRFNPDNYRNELTDSQIDKLEKIYNQLNRAFTTLIDPGQRQSYNQGLAGLETSGQAKDVEKAKNLFKLGQTAFKNKDYDKAYSYYQQAHQANPDNAIYLGMLAQIEYRHFQKLDAAEQNCRKAISINADNPKLYIILGKILKGKNQLQEAKAAFKRALALDSSNKIAIAELKNLQ